MPVEFLGVASTNDASESSPCTTSAFDPGYLERLVRVHEDYGWNRVLLTYGSFGPDPASLATYIASRLERIELLLSHRPNVSCPTYAAKTFATIDQLSGGRLSVHFITGGNDREQRREGDTLTKDERYAHTREYIQIIKRAWTSTEPFDHHGDFYQLENFILTIKPFQGRVPTISFGGSSDPAYRVGSAEADVYSVWGEPLANTREQIERVQAEAFAAGRTVAPRIHAAFRAIIAPTEKFAWEKAHRVLSRIDVRKAAASAGSASSPTASWPENTGSRRLLEIAAAGERFDSVLWTAISRAVDGYGNSNALVGTPEQVAEALLAYYDLGVRVISVRGFDLIDDVIDFGRHVIPIVREEVSKRDQEDSAL